MTTLQSENHLHLYGCLTAKSLFKHSTERAKKFKPRFDWFLAEYKKITGVSINPDLWWKPADGYETFKQHFLCSNVSMFEIFQAKFNLLIALFPPDPEDMTLPKEVFETHRPEGGYKEYRTFLPLYLSADQRALYLKKLIETAKEHETEAYHPRLAISFSRQNSESWDSYRFLFDFIEKNPELRPWITGIDFCASERGHPPKTKKDLFNAINSDYQQGLHDLNILYHVGEMWQDIALHSAARWCIEASELGVQRLGHALALGMNPENLRERKIQENVLETNDHLAWLRRHRFELHENGFTTKDYEWLTDYVDSNTSGDLVTWHYRDDLIYQTQNFQNALLKIIKNFDPVVETCPTSNIRIGNLKKPSFHPIPRFLDHRLRVTISTDDPGIFDITLSGEERIVGELFKVSNEQLKSSEALSRSLLEPRG